MSPNAAHASGSECFYLYYYIFKKDKQLKHDALKAIKVCWKPTISMGIVCLLSADIS